MTKRLGAAFAGVLLAFSSCRPQAPEELSPEAGGLDVSQLRAGDVVCRYGDGVWSELFRNSSTRDKRFSHVGILVLEAGEPWVIHASANDRTGSGAVCEEPLSDFLTESRDFAIFRLSGDDDLGSWIAANARAYLDVPFDAKFDLACEKKIYCSELVRLCVNAAAGDEIVTTSFMHGREIVAIDDCYLHSSFLLVHDSRPTADESDD